VVDWREPDDEGHGEPENGTDGNRPITGSWPAVRSQLERLDGSADIVVISAPPLLAGGDVLSACAEAPAWMVCLPLATATGDDADAVRRETALVPRPATGLVVVEPAG